MYMEESKVSVKCTVLRETEKRPLSKSPAHPTCAGGHVTPVEFAWLVVGWFEVTHPPPLPANPIAPLGRVGNLRFPTTRES